jgi:hypothetical protein
LLFPPKRVIGGLKLFEVVEKKWESRKIGTSWPFQWITSCRELEAEGKMGGDVEQCRS